MKIAQDKFAQERRKVVNQLAKNERNFVILMLNPAEKKPKHG
jgi:hypothetical protein